MGSYKKIVRKSIAGLLAWSLIFGVMLEVEVLAMKMNFEDIDELSEYYYNRKIPNTDYYTVVLDYKGNLWTWGSNDYYRLWEKNGHYGALGNGTRKNSLVPVKIMEGVKYAADSYAIKEDGSLWTWGSNEFGQLGNGRKEDSLVPVKIMEDVKYADNCWAIKEDGSLWTWGNNEFGRLENGTKEDSLVPVKIMEDVKFANVMWYGSWAIKEDGSLWTWGNNEFGQLGNGRKEDSLVPVKIMEDVKIANVTASVTWGSSWAIKEDGSLWTWGSNEFGRLGNGTTKDSSVPVKIMDNVKYAGDSYAVKNDGSLWTWGNNNGQLGNGTTKDSSVPVKIMEDVKIANVMWGSSWAIKEDGSLWTWGRNNSGQLGNGTTKDSSVPVKIMEDVKIANVMWDSSSSWAIKEDGSLWTWGSDYDIHSHQSWLEDSLIPVKIMEDVKYVDYAYNVTRVIKKDGSLWAWGSNSDGQLGNGTTEDSIVPIKIMDLGSPTNYEVEEAEEEPKEDEENTYNYDDLEVGDKIGNGVVVRKGDPNVTCLLEMSDENIFKGKVRLKYRGWYEHLESTKFYLEHIDEPANIPNIIWDEIYERYMPYEAEDLDYDIIKKFLTNSELKKFEEDKNYSLDLYIEPTGYYTFVLDGSGFFGAGYTDIPVMMRYEDYEKSLQSTDNLIIEEEQKAEINYKTINEVTDEKSAVNSIGNLIVSISKEELNKSYNVDNVQLAMENAVANSTKIKDMNEKISMEDLIKQINEVNATKQNIEEVAKENGLNQNRKIRSSVKLESENDKVKIEFDDTFKNINLDQILVSSNDVTLKLPNELFDGQAFDVEINKLSNKERFYLSKNDGGYFNFIWNEIVNIFKNLSVNTKIFLENGDITELSNVSEKSSWYNFEVDKELSNVITISLPVLNGETDNQTIIKSDGTNVAGKYNVATNTIDARVQEDGIYAVRKIEADFTDIEDKSIEMQKAIKYISAKGIVSENYFDEFKPDDEITRAEITTLLIKALGKYDINADGNFNDVTSKDWYFAAAGSAKESNIIDGYADNTFRGMNNILKNEFTVLSSNTIVEEMGYYGVNDVSEYLTYSDNDDIRDWSKESIALATREGLVIPKTNNKFDAEKPMTRGEAAVVIYRIFNKLW